MHSTRSSLSRAPAQLTEPGHPASAHPLAVQAATFTAAVFTFVTGLGAFALLCPRVQALLCTMSPLPWGAVYPEDPALSPGSHCFHLQPRCVSGGDVPWSPLCGALQEVGFGTRGLGCTLT